MKHLVHKWVQDHLDDEYQNDDDDPFAPDKRKQPVKSRSDDMSVNRTEYGTAKRYDLL